MRKIVVLFVVAFCLLSTGMRAQHTFVHKQSSTYEWPEDSLVLKKLDQWRDLKFGVIFHWGLYAVPGIVESWALCSEDVDWISRYGHNNYQEFKDWYWNGLSKQFNPTEFEPAQWAEVTKQAGMKYMIFTTKHHDGFCMFDSQYTDFSISRCAFKEHPKADVAKYVFEAFRKEGFMTGAYFSKPDWHNQDYWWDYFPPKDRNINYPPEMFPEKWQRLNDFINNQLNELTGGKYGNLGMLWFDLCDASPDRHPQWERFAKTVRTNQPGIMMVARHTNTIYENYRTPEQKIPDRALDYPWEACMTMATQWSYKPDDSYKSTHDILTTLVQIVSRGGNFLLNVGPGPDGELAPEAYQRFKEIGDWMQVNSEGIHGTKAIAPYKEDRIAFTSKDNNVYAFYLNAKDEYMPSVVKIRSFVPVSAKSVFLMGHNRPLKWKKTGDGIEIIIPESVRKNPPCDLVWGFKLKIK